MLNTLLKVTSLLTSTFSGMWLLENFRVGLELALLIGLLLVILMGAAQTPPVEHSGIDDWVQEDMGKDL